MRKNSAYRKKSNTYGKAEEPVLEEETYEMK